MKKKKLKTLSINKEKISSLEEINEVKGGSWLFCHSNASACLCSGYNTCGRPLLTGEGPCVGGTASCVVSGVCQIP